MDESVARALLQSVRIDAAAEGLAVPAEELLAAAAERSVAGLVARVVSRSVAGLAPDTAEAVAEFLRHQRHHRGLHLVETERAVEALVRAGIPAAILKGPALALEVYDDPVDRSFRDIDVLVPEPRVREAVDVLATLGYGVAVTPRLAEVYRRYHYHWLLSGSGRPNLELHWHLVRPDDALRLDPAEFLAGARPPSRDVGWHAPPRHLQLLHAALDIAVSGLWDLKRLVDIDRLLRSDLEAQPVAMAAAARRTGLDGALRLGCELASRLLGAPAGALLDELGPDRRVAALLDGGAERLVLGMPPAQQPLLNAWLRYRLSPPGTGRGRRLLLRSRFDRARLKEEGVGSLGRAQVAAKRLVKLTQLLGRLSRLAHDHPHTHHSRLTRPSSSSS